MNTELEQEAKKYANIPLHRDIDTEERYFNSDCIRMMILLQESYK